MAKKKADEEPKKEESSSVWKQIGESLLEVTKAAAATSAVKSKASKMKKTVKKQIISGLLIALGAIFLIISGIYYLDDIYYISYGASTLSLGIIALIIGLAYRA